MHLRLVTLLFTATIVSWVGSRCYDFRLGAADYNSICKGWWDYTYRSHFTFTDYGIKSCIKLIEKRCPNMITVVPSTFRGHDDKKGYETWSSTVSATLNSNKGTYIRYNEEEKKPICFDNGLEYCSYWWSVVKENNVKDEIKEVCINNMLKHCGSKINKKSEGKSTEVQRCLSTYDVKAVTYKYNAETASINQCVPVKET